MLAQASAKILHHLLAQQPWRTLPLQAFAGRIIRLETPLANVTLGIQADGFVQALGAHPAADTTLRFPALRSLIC